MLEDYKDVLKVNDLCEILGYSKNTIYKKLKTGLIKYHRDMGGNYIIKKKYLLDYLNIDNCTDCSIIKSVYSPVSIVKKENSI